MISSLQSKWKYIYTSALILLLSLTSEPLSLFFLIYDIFIFRIHLFLSLGPRSDRILIYTYFIVCFFFSNKPFPWTIQFQIIVPNNWERPEREDVTKQDQGVRNTVTRWRELSILFIPALAKLLLECCVQFWAPRYEQDFGKLGRVQWKVNNLVRELEHVMMIKPKIKQDKAPNNEIETDDL